MQRNEDTISIQIQSQRFYTFETRTAHSTRFIIPKITQKQHAKSKSIIRTRNHAKGTNQEGTIFLFF